MRRVLEVLMAGCCVYLVVAACSGDTESDSSLANASESGSRLKVRWLVASDGAKQFGGWYDTQRNENCTFQKAPDGVMRCLPEVTVNWGGTGAVGEGAFSTQWFEISPPPAKSRFTDAECSQPAVVAFKPACTPDHFYGIYGLPPSVDANACEPWSLYSLTKITEQIPIYGPGLGAHGEQVRCTRVDTVDPNPHAYFLFTKVEFTEFAQVSEQIDQ